eukprot:552856-Pyramimonas_sp.AAC.1
MMTMLMMMRRRRIRRLRDRGTPQRSPLPPPPRGRPEAAHQRSVLPWATLACSRALSMGLADRSCRLARRSEEMPVRVARS